MMRTFTLNGLQLRDALAFINPDGSNDPDQLETELSFAYLPDGAIREESGKCEKPGMYCWLTEYPEEGVYGPLTGSEEWQTSLDGAEMIAQERQRQIQEEGYTPANDDAYKLAELLNGARSYLWAALVLTLKLSVNLLDIPSSWPWAREFWKPSDTPERNLVRAGALIAAEIDRQRRAALAAAEERPRAEVVYVEVKGEGETRDEV